MATPSSLYPRKVDLTNCDKEPIHLIGAIQDHGYLLAFDIDSGALKYHSANAIELFPDKKGLLGRLSLGSIITGQNENLLQAILEKRRNNPIEVDLSGEIFLAIVHRTDGYTIVELEKKVALSNIRSDQQDLVNIVSTLDAADTVLEMCRVTAKSIKELTGYDRVMVYRFDAEWNGEVIAEEKKPHLNSWLGLHYPATDIPQQARKLFLKIGVRIIRHTEAETVPVISSTNSEDFGLDLSNAELRAVSPIHIEYLTNMGVSATLTAAIVYKGVLWGLIACHHNTPKYIDYHKRFTVRFITQVFSTQLGLMLSNEMLQHVNTSNRVRATLMEKIAQRSNIVEALVVDKPDLSDMMDCIACGLFFEKQYHMLGKEMEHQLLQRILETARANHGDQLFHTQNLSTFLELTDSEQKLASGIMVLFLSPNLEDALIWARPEMPAEVSWGGNPEKAVLQENAKLRPRNSFEKWVQIKTGFAKTWNDAEIAAALELKRHISEVMVQKYDEVKELNQKLQKAYEELEAFSYSVSHDLRSPLRGIDGFAQIMKEDYFEQLDDYGKQAVETIISSTKKMNSLIDDILAFSGLGKNGPSPITVDSHVLANEVLSYLQCKVIYPNTKISLHKLPKVKGDSTMLFQLFVNLVGNALKYSSKVPNPEVGISYNDGVFAVSDNGVGFNDKHKDRIFDIFSRLETDNFEGSGIGLAIAKRVVDFHEGKIWAKSSEGNGAIFYFTLNLKEHA